MFRRFSALFLVASLTACSVLPGDSKQAPRAPARQQASGPIDRGGAAGQCLSELGQMQADFTPLPDRYLGKGCSNLNTVKLSGLHGDLETFSVTNLGPVTCSTATAFAGWARYGADRAARQILGSPLKRIETFGSYNCRNVAGSNRRSAHATADAIDISAFVLANGQRISVLGDWSKGSSAERRFLRVVHESACKRFATVLGPEYNAAHLDHLHIEGTNEGKSYCR
ncbi:extensin family protein [Altericroceibacterium endophyticum]|uniref:Extensin n=1 Tax=Altericroceibacterium endophyticum TaxID=1808508 RepID=A0A6I4T4J0_9SPHN|nr:extensin family protein [Altericroceibacterium endophyticum]MXO64973.1 extensin [Altericroceibacterium endophyticum]